MFRFSLKYFIYAVLLFMIEFFIGFYMTDAYIRPYGGDFLVVIFIYCTARAFFKTPVVATCLGVLLFSYIVEISQYFNLVYVLGWGNSRTARILMGTHFSFIDLLAYTLGIGLVLLIEKICSHEK